MFGNLWKRICRSTSNNRLSFSGMGRGDKEKTTPVILVTSVFAQPDSESEESFKCGVEITYNDSIISH